MDNSMTALDNSQHFQKWTDPESEVISYILNSDTAPQHQTFYFTNPSLSCDGRYFWFYCAFPPGGSHNFGRTLAVCDLTEDRITHFPETMFLDASPMVWPETGEVFWCTHHAVWKRSPLPDSEPIMIADLREQLTLNRPVWRLATHLTRSSNSEELFIDAQIGRDFIVGSLNIASGDFSEWQRFDRCFNHAQFSPTDPDLALIAEDYWNDPLTGEKFPYKNRLWLIRRGEEAAPIYPDGQAATHEWWDPDGQHVWYISPEGTARVNTASGETIIVWPQGRWHSHSSQDGLYLVGDNTAPAENWRRGCASHVSFFNTVSGKSADIVSMNPYVDPVRGNYHMDPHPQFLANDALIAHTTTVTGRVSAALTPAAQLIELTS